MGNFILFINSLFSYLLLMAVIILLVAIGIFVGIKLRKIKSAKEEELKLTSQEG